MFNPLKHPICFASPLRLTTSTWVQHLPFAMYLVDILRPSVIVELGTHYGVSYCGFCQAVKQLGIDTRSYAVDTWQGDPHAGLYGPEVLAELKQHHDPLYGSFSRLIQSTFDEALVHFSDDSIDLLHVDGFHSYDAARRDFHNWLPKMSQRGIVMFHDINVRERGFGLWKLWDELKSQYQTFSFVHGHGLGILAVGERFPESLMPFFNASSHETTRIREFFHLLGSRHGDMLDVEKIAQLTRELKELKIENEELYQYIGKVQGLWSFRLLQVWSNEGFQGVAKKCVRKMWPRIFPPRRKDSWDI